MNVFVNFPISVYTMNHSSFLPNVTGRGFLCLFFDVLKYGIEKGKVKLDILTTITLTAVSKVVRLVVCKVNFDVMK